MRHLERFYKNSSTVLISDLNTLDGSVRIRKVAIGLKSLSSFVHVLFVHFLLKREGEHILGEHILLVKEYSASRFTSAFSPLFSWSALQFCHETRWAFRIQHQNPQSLCLLFAAWDGRRSLTRNVHLGASHWLRACEDRHCQEWASPD
jgi:hypothetical protein